MAVLEAPNVPNRSEEHSGILWSVESRRDMRTVREVVLSVLEAIATDESELVLLFCSPQFHIAEVAAAVAEYGAAMPVVGCTTAGEITPLGYRHGTITGLSLPKAHFSVSLQLFEQLAGFDLADGFSAARTLLAQHEAADFHAKMPNSFAVLLNDGLSMREEAIASAFGNALGHVPLVGGSAGISAVKNEPNMLLGGRVLTNSAVLMLVSTDLDFRVFQTQHFEALSQKLVITRADPSRRVVMQINAEPAAQEYARLLGLTRADLTSQVFALHPLVVRAGGRFYARSIQKVNDDDSLQFFCAIDEGIVLSIARSGDLVADLEEMFEKLGKDLGSVQMTIGFDCILRYIEMEQGDMLAKVSRLHGLNNVIGFNTYGEQFGTMHMSQTFTGIAFGHHR